MKSLFNFNPKTKIRLNFSQVLKIYHGIFFVLSLSLLIWMTFFLYRQVYLTVSATETSLSEKNYVSFLSDINLEKFNQVIDEIQTKTSPKPIKYYRNIFQPLQESTVKELEQIY